MNANEKWNLVVALVQSKKFAKESEVQQLWQGIFADANFLGYSQIGGEIDAQRQMRIGSYERTIPDIIIRDGVNRKDLFVVELKQHNLPFQTKFKEQLFSYMRLLRLAVGVLICEKLYLFVLDNDDNELVLEIPFEEDNFNGNKFVELFSKGNFSQQDVKNFINENYKFDKNVKIITQDIFAVDIKNLVAEHYQQKYSEAEIDAALAQIQIKIQLKENNNTVLPNLEEPSKPIMGKSKAVEIFRNRGYQLNHNVTFASRNKSTYSYWANPDFTNLEHEFWLILNDNLGKVMYLFKIPANAIQKSQLTARRDIPTRIDLQIEYNNSAFKDRRSGYSFLPFYLTKIDY